MSRVNGSALMFNEEDIESTTEFLPRLIRVVFYGLGITNNGYLERFYHYFQEIHRDKTRKEFSQKAAADRKFLLDPRKLTFNMMTGDIAAMGWNMKSVSIEIQDRLTGEVKTFSTNMTVDDLKDLVARDNEVGVQSVF